MMISGLRAATARARVGDNEVDVIVSVDYIHDTLDGRGEICGRLWSDNWPADSLQIGDELVTLTFSDSPEMRVYITVTQRSWTKETGLWSMEARFLEERHWKR